MKETLSDISQDIIYKISGKDPTDLDIFFDEKTDLPLYSNDSRGSVTIPLPMQYGKNYYFLGFLFSDYELMHESIWTLYLASIIKTAAQIFVSSQMDWKQWSKNKTSLKRKKTINFIEDVLSKNYLKEKFPEYNSEIEKIEKKISETIFSTTNTSKNTFAITYSKNKLSETELKQKIIKSNNSKKILMDVANYVYKNIEEFNSRIFPNDLHCGNYYYQKSSKTFQIRPGKGFQKLVSLCDEFWIDEKIHLSKMKKKYSKISEDLKFDTIKFSDENIGEYLRLKNESSLFLKKLRNQLKMISNIVDVPNSEDIGTVEMQKAIQAMASENDSIQIFEQDEARRTDENWAIIMDTSASMKLKFDDMKKFALCLSETADELNSRGGKWGFFCFNNEFLIVKDHSENYSQTTKARIGGIDNKGLSFIPDAIKLTSRMLALDSTEKKFIFVISDGKSLGYDEIDESFKIAIKEARQSGINVIGIGVPEGISKLFTLSMPHENLKKTVAKFINAYVEIAQSGM